MNRSLDALFTKLKWKLHELCNKLLSIQQKIESLEQDLLLNQQKTSNSCAIPTLIMPEKEIARSHFMTLQQQRQAALQSEQKVLIAQQTRLNMELKMLEKHQAATLKTQQQQTWLKEQNTSDEWILQRRDTNEN